MAAAGFLFILAARVEFQRREDADPFTMHISSGSVGGAKRAARAE
jgi:hypothetical protein